MIYTTLKAIKEHSPCEDGWKKLLESLNKKKADDSPLPLVHILESNGLDDALWCLRALPDELQSKVRLFNCDTAERALQYWEKKYPDDKRPHEAIAVSRRFADGNATHEELAAARAAADAAAWAADAARAAAWDAGAAAADAAADAARSAARDAAAWAAADAAWASAAAAARNAARDAARSAARAAARAAAWAAADAARSAARAAEIEAQKQLFIKYFGTSEKKEIAA